MPLITERLLSAAHHAPSADNSQPWQLRWQENSLTVCYDTKRVASKTFPPNNPATLLTIGALLENISQFSRAQGLQYTLKIPDQLNLENPVYFKATFDSIDNSMDVDETSIPLFNRHTNRHPYLKQALPEENIEALNTLTLNNARLVVFEDRAQIKRTAELVRLASKIRFQTQEIHEWLGKSLRFGHESEESNDGLDVKTLDLPPGGKTFLRLISNWQRMKMLNIFGAYRALSAIDSNPIKQAPAIVAIISPSGFKDILSAGQLMNKAWIDLNDQGIAVQPYYVVADQLHRREAATIPNGLEKKADIVFEKANNIFQLNQNESLQMLLRIGYPTTKPVLSKRLPLETVCS